MPDTPKDTPQDDVIEELLRHQEWARRLARRLVRDEAGADDVVQQTLLAAIEHPPADATTPRPWLARVVRSWVARGARSQGRRDRREREARREGAAESAYDVVERADLQRFLANELFELGEPYRTTLLLRYFDGLTIREIAERTGVPLETARTRLRRGLAGLRARLEDRARRTGRDWRGGLLALVAGGEPRGDAAPASSPSPRGPSLAAAASFGVLAAGVVLLLASGAHPAWLGAPGTTPGGDAAAGSRTAHRAAHARDAGAPGGAAAADVAAADATLAGAASRIPVRGPSGAIAGPAPWVDGSAFVSSLAFVPDGRLLVSGASDGAVKLWNVQAGEVVRTLRGHDGAVACVAASADGTRVLSGGADATVRIWDAARGDELAVVRVHDAAVRQIALGAGGLVASSDTSGTVVAWRLADGAVVRRIAAYTGGAYARSLAFSPDGRTLFTAPTTYDGVAAWDLGGGETPRAVHPGVGRICRSDAAAGGLWVAASDGPVLLSPAGESLRRLAGAKSEITALEVAGAGGVVLAGTRDGDVHGWTRDDDRPRWTTRLRARDVRALAISADSSLAAYACSTGRIWLLDPRTGTSPAAAQADGHTWAISGLSVDPAGRFVASSSWDGTVKLWDLTSHALLRTLRGHEDWVVAVDVSPCGRFVASASHDRTVRVWDAATGRALQVLAGHRDIVGAVKFDPDGRHLLSGSQDGTAILWDVETGAPAQTFRGHTDEIRGVAFLPGDRVATASEDATIRIWSRETGRELSVLRGHEGVIASLAATPGGARLVSGGHDRTVRVWDAETGACLATLTGPAGWVHDVAVSCDGRWVAAASHDANLRRWDLATFTPVDVLSGHQVSADGLAFLPEGRVVSGGWDQRILLWDPAEAPPR